MRELAIEAIRDVMEGILEEAERIGLSIEDMLDMLNEIDSHRNADKKEDVDPDEWHDEQKAPIEK